MGLGKNREAQDRTLAVLVDRILKEADSAELPVAATTDYLLAVNLGMARRLGLTLPESVLRRTTEVIQ